MIGTMPGAQDTELINTWFLLSWGLKFSGGSRHVKSQLKYRVIVVINYRKDEKYKDGGEDAPDSAPGKLGCVHPGGRVEVFPEEQGCQQTAGLLPSGQRAQQMHKHGGEQWIEVSRACHGEPPA